MKPDVLHDILADAGVKRGETFDLRGEATFMLDAGGSLIIVDNVKSAFLKGAFLVAKNLRGESYLCEPEAVVCLKLARGGDEGTGFV